MKRKLSDQQKIEIVDKYKTGKYSGVDLAHEYGVSGQGILGILTKRGIKIDSLRRSRKYTLNHNYFDKIDTEEKAYILGWMYSDGYNGEDVGRIMLGIQEGDRSILERINKEIGSNRPLRFTEKKTKNQNHENIYILSINSVIMSSQLSKLGCFQAKGLTLKFPTAEQVSRELMRHFLRGMYDGDGCLYIGPRKNRKAFTISIKMVSTHDFCLGVMGVAKTLGISSTIYVNPKALKLNKSTATISISGHQQCYKFAKWLYEDSTIYLERKMNKFLEIESYLRKEKLIEGDLSLSIPRMDFSGLIIPNSDIQAHSGLLS